MFAAVGVALLINLPHLSRLARACGCPSSAEHDHDGSEKDVHHGDAGDRGRRPLRAPFLLYLNLATG
ncbi:hypothetical protein ACGFI9_34520 [Micromonospora sp. NPDC048930]|uniref:hypothetical protein n=1 Tax=Micromonospora sp. NPDC048930 TaxID=3364261 RepID=UPI00371F7C7C